MKTDEQMNLEEKKHQEEKRIKYLEFIENVINRMSDLSFRCKEFCILILTGLIALYSTISTNRLLIILCCTFTALLFWVVDSFYLYKERQYRMLYQENEIFKDEEVTDFNLCIKNIGKREKIGYFFKAMFGSLPNSIFYISSLVVCVALIIYTAYSLLNK